MWDFITIYNQIKLVDGSIPTSLLNMPTQSPLSALETEMLNYWTRVIILIVIYKKFHKAVNVTFAATNCLQRTQSLNSVCLGSLSV